MQEQVVSLMNSHANDNKTNCFSYIVHQCSFCAEHFGIIVKKVLCRSWPILSQQSRQNKKKQVNMIELYLYTNLMQIRNLSFIIISFFPIQSNPNTSSLFS